MSVWPLPVQLNTVSSWRASTGSLYNAQAGPLLAALENEKQRLKTKLGGQDIMPGRSESSNGDRDEVPLMPCIEGFASHVCQ